MKMLSRTWKEGLVVSFLMVICMCCALNTTESTKPSNPNSESPLSATIPTTPDAPPPYDTITIDLDESYLQAILRNKQYAELSTPALVDSLLILASKQEVLAYKDDKVLFGPAQEMGQYYENNVPRSLYTKLFPKEEIETQVERVRELSTDESKRIVYLKEGRKIVEDRKNKQLYAANNKTAYLQLIFTQQGKYCPEVTLYTFSKKDLKLIGQVKLFGGIYDSYDIDYWHAALDENYDGVAVTRVKNLKFDDIALDTTVVNYAITSSGEILQQH